MALREIKIVADDNSAFYFGQKLYTIEAFNCIEFFEDCPICNNSKSIELKGIKMPCPYCSATSRIMRHDSYVGIRRYDVIDIYINSVHIEGDTKKVDYKSQKNLYAKYVTYSAFYSFKDDKKRAHDYVKRLAYSNVFEMADDVTPEDCYNAYRGGRCLFFKKADAKHFAALLNEYQRHELEVFNKEHLTNHAYPYGEVK